MGRHGTNAERLAEDAEGHVEAAALDGPIDDQRRLVDLLAPDEQPHYLLEGAILDSVNLRDGTEHDDRTRNVAPADGAVLALVTDRAVRLVVSYGDSATTHRLGFDDLSEVSLNERGRDRRIRFAVDGNAWDVYPSDDSAVCANAVAFVTDRIGSSDGYGTERTTLDRLERLADLRDRGAITETEFETLKRDLLDEL